MTDQLEVARETFLAWWRADPRIPLLKYEAALDALETAAQADAEARINGVRGLGLQAVSWMDHFLAGDVTDYTEAHWAAKSLRAALADPPTEEVKRG